MYNQLEIDGMHEQLNDTHSMHEGLNDTHSMHEQLNDTRVRGHTVENKSHTTP